MILAALLFAAAAADAGPDCTSDSLPQQDMNLCAGEDYEAAEAELNAQWKITAKLMQMMDGNIPPFNDDGAPSYYQTLLDGQRGWLNYRQAQCNSEGYAFAGGSMEPFIISTCLARMAKARTQELRELASSDE